MTDDLGMAAEAEEVHGAIRRLAMRAATAPTLADAEVALRELTAVLPAHLAEEEGTNGLFQRLLAGDENAVVERLRREHRELRNEVADLLDRVMRRAPDAAPRLQKFLRHVLQHEWIENATIVRVLRGPAAPEPAKDDPSADGLLRDVLARVEATQGSYLAAVTVGAAGDAADAACLADTLKRLLCECGLDGVDVTAVPADAPCLLNTQFEDRWA